MTQLQALSPIAAKPEDAVQLQQLQTARSHFGDNRALTIYSEIGTLEDRLNNLGDVTALNAPIMRDVMADAHKYASAMEEERMADQKPVTEKLELIRSAFRPVVDRALIVKGSAQMKLNTFMEAERIRLQREADELQAAAEAEAALAREAEEELNNASGFTANPQVADDLHKSAAELGVEARYATKVADSGPKIASASGSARAAGQRVTYSAKMTDGVKLAKFFAKNPEVQAAALKAASAMMRASKGTATIPGAEAVETRNAV